MKTSHLAALAAVVLAMCMLLSSRASAQTDPSVAVGALSAYPTIARTGTYPTLTWGISYPQTVADIVTINTDGTLTPKTVPLTMDVRVLGASVIVATTDYYGNLISSYYIPVSCQFSYNGGTWQQIFYGDVYAVNPATVVLTKSITSKYTLDFGGKYNWNGSWGPFINTLNYTNNNRNVIALKNGDYPPVTCPLYNQPTVASFLKPYMAADGQVIIGPKDVIYLFEITTTNTNDPGFDMNDLAILVTFR